MVWGWFWSRKKGTFTPLIVNLVNKQVYLQLLQYLLLPVLIRVNNIIVDPIYMQDNAPIHKAKIVTSGLRKII
jgi:hypothetical protein